MKPYVEAKAWKTPLDAVSSYQNLEKIHRTPADRTVVLPEKPDDAEAWSQVYAKLGRPETPEGYQFEGYEPAPDGGFDLMQGENGFPKVAHKLGLSTQAASELWQWYQGQQEAQQQQAQQMQAERATAAMDSMKVKWGAAYDANLAAARGAIERLGLANEQGQKALVALESHPELGTEWLLNTFLAIGKSLGEHERQPVQAEPERGSFAVSPGEAQMKINELLGDENFRRKYFEGSQTEVARIRQLTEIAAGTQPIRAPIRP